MRKSAASPHSGASPDNTGTQPIKSRELTLQASNSFFNGNIDEVRVWNRGLSSQEVADSFAGNFSTAGQVLDLPFSTSSSLSTVSSNSAPTVNNQLLSTNENTPLPITLTASDPENDILTYSLIKQPSEGTLTGKVPSLVYIPRLNHTGLDTLTFKANDGSSDSRIGTVSISVNNTSQVGKFIPGEVNEGQTKALSNLNNLSEVAKGNGKEKGETLPQTEQSL